jgi:hypothetical protein
MTDRIIPKRSAELTDLEKRLRAVFRKHIKPIIKELDTIKTAVEKEWENDDDIPEFRPDLGESTEVFDEIDDALCYEDSFKSGLNHAADSVKRASDACKE